MTLCTRNTSPESEEVVLNVKRKTWKKIQSDRKEAVEQWSGGKRRGTDCEQEDGVTAANQISLSLGCLMSILLCDSHLTTLSTMNTRSTRFSIASLFHSQIKEGMHQNGTKTKEREKERKGEMLKTQWGSFIHVWALRITEFSPLMLEYLSARRICVSSSPTQSLPGQIVCLSVSVSLQHKAPSKTSEWFRAQLNIYSTETEAKHSKD